MILNRWNWRTREYEPYEVPDDRRCTTLSFDMDRIVDCASCGESLPFGRTYTSLEIHTQSGMGYGVCEKCYEAECGRRSDG